MIHATQMHIIHVPYGALLLGIKGKCRNDNGGPDMTGVIKLSGQPRSDGQQTW